MFHGVGQAFPGVSEGEMFVDEEPHYAHEEEQAVYVAPTSRPASSSSTITTTGYCPPHSSMCLTSAAARQAAVDACRVPRVRGYKTRGGLLGLMGLGRVCTIYSESHTVKVNPQMVTRWNPCYLKDLPLCPGTPLTPQFDPGPDEPPPPVEEDEDNMFMIGGILAALVVAGGVGYAVFRKKKKGKRKRK